MFRDFFRFCIKPTLLNKQKQVSFDDKLFTIFGLWLLVSVISFSINRLFFLLQEVFHLPEAFTTYSPLTTKNETLLNNFELAETLGLLGILFSAVLIAPLVEEIIFRGPLRLSRWFLLIIFSFITGVILFITTPLVISVKFSDLTESWSDITVLSILVLIFFGLPLAFFTSTERYWFGCAQKFLKKYFSIFVWIFCIAFALIHSVNYLERTTVTPFLLLTTLSYLPISFALAYIRIIYGLQYSIALHLFNNAIVFIPITLITFFETL